MEYAIKKSDNYESVEFFSHVILTEGKAPIQLQCKIADAPYALFKTISQVNLVTDTGYQNGMDFKLTSTKPFSYTYPFLDIKYYDKHKVEDFLYEISYGKTDYDYAYLHIADVTSGGGCSSIRNGNFFGRNFDWKYDNEVLFVVHTPSAIDRLGVIGVSGIIPGVLKSTVDLESITVDGVDMFKLLPFFLLDGINEKGVFCTHNVVPLDDRDDPTLEVPALIEEREKVCNIMLVRFILDRFYSAELAIDYITKYVTVYFSEDLLDKNYQTHFMIGDKNSTYILEFINGEYKVMLYNYITNFPIYGVTFNEDGTIKRPAVPEGMNPYGSGLERWDKIVTNYATSNTIDGMRLLLDEVKFSNCYTYDEGDFWYSEIVGMLDDSLEDEITVDTDPDFCSSSYGEVMENWEDKDRSTGKVWITCHSSIYDIKHKCLYIRNQEGDTEYHFYI